MTAPRCLLALLAVLALAAAAPAAMVRGVVTRVDLDKKELELEARGLGLRGAVLVFALQGDTAVLFGDQPGALADLDVGRRVRIEYEPTDGRQVAQVIHLLNGPRPAGPVVVAPPGAPAAPPNGDALTGVLRRVGYSDREVVLVGPGPKGPDTETTVAVPEAARIVKNGKDATLEDLKEGDAATVQIEKKDGRPSALAIQVGPGGAPAAADRPASRLIPRIRMLLKAADQVLQGMENRDRDP